MCKTKSNDCCSYRPCFLLAPSTHQWERIARTHPFSTAPLSSELSDITGVSVTLVINEPAKPYTTRTACCKQRSTLNTSDVESHRPCPLYSSTETPQPPSLTNDNTPSRDSLLSQCAPTDVPALLITWSLEQGADKSPSRHVQSKALHPFGVGLAAKLDETSQCIPHVHHHNVHDNPTRRQIAHRALSPPALTSAAKLPTSAVKSSSC